MKVHYILDFNLPYLYRSKELIKSACGTPLYNHTLVSHSPKKATCKNCKKSIKEIVNG